LVGGGLGVLTIGLLVAGFSMGWFGGGDSTPKSSNPPATQKGGPGPSAKNEQPQPEPEKKDEGEKPVASVGDVTNLLPDSSHLVIAIDGKKFLATPAGITLFDPNGGSEPLIKNRMGFGSREVQKVVFGSNLLDGWTWTIVQTKAPLKIEAVKAAIDPEA